MIKIGVVALVGLFAILAACSGAQAEKSVSVGGHTFTANLDDSWVTKGSTIPYDPQTYPQDFEDNQGNIDSGVNDWTGFENNASFSHESGTENGVVCIYVIKPKQGIPDSEGFDIKSPGILLDVGCMLLGDLHTSVASILKCHKV